MAHHSRLAGFIIDCQDGSLSQAAMFWSQALGLAVTDPDEGGDDLYAVLQDGPGRLQVEVQKVAHPSRVHLDIETDDIEAEVTRLEALGAKRVQWVRERWWVMQAPTGHRFCVVPMRNVEGRAAPNAWARCALTRQLHLASGCLRGLANSVVVLSSLSSQCVHVRSLSDRAQPRFAAAAH